MIVVIQIRRRTHVRGGVMAASSLGGQRLRIVSIALLLIAIQWPGGQLAAAGEPRGRLVQGAFEASTIFPSTRREWSVYVPAEYGKAEPARLMVFQDGPAYAKADGPLTCPPLTSPVLERENPWV